ncbi:hypothetical protein ACROYT_G017131 [Oculina patagonica]
MYVLATLVVFCLGCVASTIAGPTCEPIKIPLCEKHLPYNMTMFPNALEQLSQHHARQKIELFRAIVAINCSKEAGFFLCSYHLPICAPEFKSKPIRPCRSVCKKVMADCLATIRRYKREWPEDVVCEDLPSYETDVCVTPSSFVNSVSSCQCNKPRLNYHWYQRNSYSFVLKVHITSSTKKGNQRVLKGRVQRVLQKGLVDLKKGDTVHLHSNTTCDCPQVNQLDAEYLVAGHEDVGQNKLYLLPRNGVVEPWERAWVGKFRKWEKRLAGKRLGRKHNRKNRKRRRKVPFFSPDRDQ